MKQLSLKNPFIMAPIKTGFGNTSGQVLDRHISFYRRRSRHLGAVIAEPFYLHTSLRELPTQMGIDVDEKIEGLARLTAAIHTEGSKVIAHLNHPGRMANPKIPDNRFLSATDRPCENGGATPTRMDESDMAVVRDLFAAAAARAERASFDVIELQFGHGYLMAQFLSPATNDRTDDYAGNLENRLRFPLSVLDAVRKATSLPIIARISADELVPAGLHMAESALIAKALAQHGVAAIHVSAGTICSSPPWFFQHMLIPKGKTWQWAKQLQDDLDVPVIFVGRINTFDDVTTVRLDMGARYVAVGRALVTDPDFVGKYLEQVPGVVRPCLACSEGCLGGVKSGQGLQCILNPLVGREDEKLIRCEQPKRIGVVGGGPAGMEAAITAAERGHAVDLYEAARLGGQWNLAALPPGKEHFVKLLSYLRRRLDATGVHVLAKPADAAILIDAGYDEVILATGAKPVIPPIEGLTEYLWAEVLEDEHLPTDSNVVVIGGGLIGIEIAHKLVGKGNEVTVIEQLQEVARNMETISKAMTLKDLKAKGAAILVGTRVTKVDGSTLSLEGPNGPATKTNVDHIVVATGMVSHNPLAPELEGKLSFHVVGDAQQVGKIKDAIRGGYDLAASLG